jgi:hypothetical protein
MSGPHQVDQPLQGTVIEEAQVILIKELNIEKEEQIEKMS